MTESLNVLFVVPARAGSKRLGNKNVRPWSKYKHGMTERVLEQLSMVRRRHRTVLTTDIEELREVCGPTHTEFHTRPQHLRGDDVQSIDVVLDVADWSVKTRWDWTYVCLAQPTSPLMNHWMYELAIDILKDEKWNAMVAVNRATMKCNGAFYFMERETFLKERTFYPAGLGIYECDNIESIDVDELEDFRIAEAVFEGRMMV